MDDVEVVSDVEAEPEEVRQKKKRKKQKRAVAAEEHGPIEAGENGEDLVEDSEQRKKKRKRAKRAKDVDFSGSSQDANDSVNGFLSSIGTAISKLSGPLIELKFATRLLKSSIGEIVKSAICSALANNLPAIVEAFSAEEDTGGGGGGDSGSSRVTVGFDDLSAAVHSAIRGESCEAADGDADTSFEFLLDETGLAEENGESEVCDDGSVNYSLDASLLEEAEKKKKDGGTKDAPQRFGGGRPSHFSCFNCQGDHNIRSCNFPQDQLRIAINKKRAEILKGQGRYHCKKLITAQYPDIAPGRASKELLRALGVGHRALPPYIYMMRTKGYPPGWLRTAQVEKSQLEVFTEEGEVGEESTKVKFDPRKIIDYPGFNVPLPPDVTDEHRRYNCPPLQEFNLKESWKAVLPFVTKEDLEKVTESPFKSVAHVDKSEDEVDDGEEEDGDGTVDKTGTSFSVPSFSALIAESEEDPEDGTSPPAPKIPGLQNWTSDITEHIPFENLPGAIGSYELVRKVFNRARRESAADGE